MNINSIQFENFVNKFYLNDSNEKMILNIDVESENDNNSEPNIYDIHTMLLDLVIKGIEIFNLDICDYEQIIRRLVPYFLNIDIKIYINNYSKLDLLNIDSLYINRYIRISPDNNLLMTINGSHQIVNQLNMIRSFCLIDSSINLCIYFDFIK
jgi:hypothetical protein